jgi:hypothetical protein
VIAGVVSLIAVTVTGHGPSNSLAAVDAALGELRCDLARRQPVS